MTFNSVSLIMSTFVMNIKKRGDEKQCPDVPHWVLWLCHVVIGRIVMTKYAWEESTNYYVEDMPVDQTTCSTERQGAQSSLPHMTPASNDKETEDASCTTELLPFHGSEPCSSQNPYYDFSGEKNKAATISAAPQRQIRVVQRSLSRASSAFDKNSDARFSVSSMCFHSLQMKRQWFYVAEVVDKFSFLIYLISMTISVTMILIVIPIYGQEKMD